MIHFRYPPRNLAVLLTLGALLTMSPRLSALSDGTLSLVSQLKKKVSSAELGQAKPVESQAVNDPELNAPPPIVTPVLAEPTPVSKPEKVVADPVPLPLDKEPAPPREKTKRKPDNAKASKGNPSVKAGKSDHAITTPDAAVGPAPKRAHPPRTSEKKALPEPADEGVKPPENSDLVKQILKKLESARNENRPGQLMKRPAKPVFPAKEETAIDISSDFPAPAAQPPSVKIAPPVAAQAKVQPPAVPTSAPALQTAPQPKGERAFGELSDEELIEYAKQHVWSSEKTRKHHPPPTPPYRPKKKTGKTESVTAKATTPKAVSKAPAAKVVTKPISKDSAVQKGKPAKKEAKKKGS